MKALRQTVDLSAYPDLVVVYLGMRVNVLTGIKTLFGFGPKIEGSVAARVDGCFVTKIFSTRCSRCTSECVNICAILNRLNALHGQNPIANGGSSFCETLEGLVFGTNFILHEAVLKRSTPMSSDLLAFSALPKPYLPKGAVASVIRTFEQTSTPTNCPLARRAGG